MNIAPLSRCVPSNLCPRLIPTVFLPLSLLSYTSIIGIISTILMVAVIFIDGFTKKEPPGSLWKPSPTDIGVTSLRELGLAFGLFMAGVRPDLLYLLDYTTDISDLVLRPRSNSFSSKGYGRSQSIRQNDQLGICKSQNYLQVIQLTSVRIR